MEPLFNPVPHPDNIAQFFDFAETSFSHGDGITYVIIDKQTDKIASSARLMKANLDYKRVEIGYTFLSQSGSVHASILKQNF